MYSLEVLLSVLGDPLLADRLERIAAVGYAPCRLRANVSGVPVAVTLDTGYPFRNSLTFHVTAVRPVSFPLLLRIPAWAQVTVVEMEGARVPAELGRFHRVQKEWKGRTQVDLTLPMRPTLCRHPGGAVSIRRGPLVYALKTITRK